MLKKDYEIFFKNKRITVMGLGLLGRGLNVSKFLAECGADLIVTDIKTREQLAPSLKKLANYKGITYVLGEHRLEDFRNRDMVIKAAGVPLDSPYIKEARKNTIPVEMDASLFMRLVRAELPDVTFIGITGTRGKSTVTQLIYEMLKMAGKRVHLGGNVRGQATLPLLKNVRSGDSVVLELDSWQLQGFGDAKMSPAIAVFTNFLPDHLTYYKGSMENYFADKANIFMYQKKDDVLIVGEKMSRLLAAMPQRFAVRVSLIVARKRDLSKRWKPRLLGEHNKENMALAMQTALSCSVLLPVVQEVIEDFRGLPGRLELVRSLRGVRYYNDTNGTTPEAVIAGLKALHTSKKSDIVLIAGGYFKDVEYAAMVRFLYGKVKALVLLEGTGTDRIIQELPKKPPYTVEVVTSMQEAVARAQSAARKGEVVLLSPGASSFGMFKNEYDRGDQFNKAVKKV